MTAPPTVRAAVVRAVEDELEVERDLGLALFQGDRDAGKLSRRPQGKT